MNTFAVQFAVYGGLKEGNENGTQAVSVISQLQRLINENNGRVTINNVAFGTDPSHGTIKQFAAIVVVNGKPTAFACQEGYVINFAEHLPPTN
jgi:hypothetical protein